MLKLIFTMYVNVVLALMKQGKHCPKFKFMLKNEFSKTIILKDIKKSFRVKTRESGALPQSAYQATRNSLILK